MALEPGLPRHLFLLGCLGQVGLLLAARHGRYSAPPLRALSMPPVDGRTRTHARASGTIHWGWSFQHVPTLWIVSGTSGQHRRWWLHTVVPRSGRGCLNGGSNDTSSDRRPASPDGGDGGNF